MIYNSSVLQSTITRGLINNLSMVHREFRYLQYETNNFCHKIAANFEIFTSIFGQKMAIKSCPWRVAENNWKKLNNFKVLSFWQIQPLGIKAVHVKYYTFGLRLTSHDYELNIDNIIS